MPKNSHAGHHHTNHEHRRIIIIVIVAIVAFGLGYIVARAKYKSQLRTTTLMVQEKDAEISAMQKQMNQIQTILKMQPSR